MTTKEVDLSIVEAGAGVSSRTWSTDGRILVSNIVWVFSYSHPSHFLYNKVPGIVESSRWAVMTSKNENFIVFGSGQGNMLGSGERVVIGVWSFLCPIDVIGSELHSVDVTTWLWSATLSIFDTTE